MLSALNQIHTAGVIHRDIKTDNILVANYTEDYIEVKIADFGLSEVIKSPDERLLLKCGSPGNIAPEVLRLVKDDPESKGYN